MGGDDERSEAGTVPAWLSLQPHQDGNGRESATSSSSAYGSSYSFGARKNTGAASTGLPSRCFQAIEAHSSGVNDVVFEKGGVLLATAGDDSYVKVWDSGSGRQRAALKVTLLCRRARSQADWVMTSAYRTLSCGISFCWGGSFCGWAERRLLYSTQRLAFYKTSCSFAVNNELGFLSSVEW